MNPTEYGLAGVADGARKLLDAARVDAVPLRHETVEDEDGEPTPILVRDDVGIGGLAGLVVDARPGRHGGRPFRVVVPFSLDLLDDGMPPGEVGRMLATQAERVLEEARS